jgi:uncharacterized protein (DUF885 family)
MMTAYGPPGANCVRELMRIFAVLFPYVAMMLAAAPALAADEPAGESFARLMDEAWQFDLQEDPLFATHVGDHQYDAKLPAISVSDAERRLAQKTKFQRRWKAIDRDRLSKVERLNYDIFGLQLANELAEGKFQTYLIPITNRSGFHISFPELPKDSRLDTVQDYENYIARLRAFGPYADGHIALMRAGVKAGLTLPEVVLHDYRKPIEAHIVTDPTRSLLYEPLTKFPARIDQAAQARLTAEGRAAIMESVVPGYRRFLAFMQDEYMPKARGSIGAAALPHGREFYRHRVKMYTTVDLTPEQVHELGRKEVERITAEMQIAMKKAGFNSDLATFVQYLRADPKFYPLSAEQLLKETAWIMKRVDGQLSKLFKTLPRTPCGLREVPAYIAADTTTAYYSQPSGDGTQPGYYYVNTSNLKSRPLYELEALSLHEALPGHHLQLALQQELGELPPFRRFSDFTAFIEGWGLYSERLGLEMGFYRDPYSEFGRLSYEMWRACRLVVDSGMHYLGWSRERAIDFMTQHTALSTHNIRAEIDRYISWPGQALAYKVGELKIRELRGRAEKQLGDKFDVREFHDVVLGSGAVPLSVLEQNVDEYIAESGEQKAESKK